jgi:hypothetical protein
MAKMFYTERDIEDLHARGVISIDVHDDVVLTELARERALKLGVKLMRVQPGRQVEDGSDAQLVHRIKAGVLARLGDRAVDPALLDTVVRRILQQMRTST